MAYTHVLFAMDHTPEVQQVGEQAKAIAVRNGARLTLVHVIEDVSITAGYELMPLVPELPDDQTIADAKKVMQDMAQTLGIPDADSQVVMAFSTKEGILKTAEKLGVDLIVVGSHSRHGLARLLGSTANAILHGTSCDVLVVKIKE